MAPLRKGFGNVEGFQLSIIILYREGVCKTQDSAGGRQHEASLFLNLKVFFLNLIMERKTLWFDNIVVDIKGEAGILASYSELSGEDVEENNFISIDTFLPNDLFERILAFLPIASIFRAGAVCKRWNSIVHSRRFSKNLSSILSRKPWYFMFTSGSPNSYKPIRNADGYDLIGFAYDPMVQKWLIPVPCPLTCGRLMNLKNKLVLVGGIGEQDQPSIIKGIGVWVLKGRDWEEFALMPSMYFQGLGNFDKVFASSGFDDLIYIQSYEAPSLLMFDMKMKKWKWSKKCPVSKRLPLQCFTGFCFEPRLELLPLGMATGQVFCGDPGPHCCP
nr:f-box/kelch-repeat protein [Quercus suber]